MKKRMTKTQIDVNIKKIKTLETKVKELNKEKAEIDAKMRELISKEPWIMEAFKGFNWEMIKTPVNKGKNTYDLNKLKKILKNVEGGLECIVDTKVVIAEQVDTKALNKLIKKGLIKEEEQEKARIEDQTYRVDYKGIATEEQEIKKMA